jgi:DsbC/DsbD-like thiol-disulfide interchange protein
VTRFVLVLLLAGALAPAARAQSFLKNQPPRIAVEARASGPITKAPQTLDILVTATPLTGIHVYAPGNPDYIAVSAAVAAVPGLTAGAPVFPAGEPYFFAPLKETVSVYSKPFVVKLPLKVSPEFLKGRAASSGDKVTLTGTVAYQACDDKVCFPPQNLPFSVDVPVKAARR